LEIFDWEALARWAEVSLTGVRPLLAVALALLRDAWAARPRSLLLMEVASLPAVPVADLLEVVLLWLLWAARVSEDTVPAEDLRLVVEVPEALLPVVAEELLRLEVVAEERRLVLDCWTVPWLSPVLRLAVVAEDLLEVPDCCCVAVPLLREAEPDWLAALEREAVDAADERETLAEDALLSREELTLVLEDLVAELPEVPVALRLVCALSASGVKDIAIARTLTIRSLI
jgi:hypothetical protein